MWKRGGHITVHQVSEAGTQEMYKKYKAVSSIAGVKMIRVFLGKPPRPNLAYQALQKRVYKGFFRLF